MSGDPIIGSITFGPTILSLGDDVFMIDKDGAHKAHMPKPILSDDRPQIIERMAKAIFDWQQSKFDPWSREVWDETRDRSALIEMAGAAYDALLAK